ncbi:MAG: hypothetical protein H7Z13_18375 [Ferruginibacter sp.]|nr:hypothetical protein [Ferruginibacter sp.]
MQKIKTSRHRQLKIVVYLAMSLAFLSALAMPFENDKRVNTGNTAAVAEVKIIDEATMERDQLAEESKAAFNEAYTVFMHPRCLNCHPSGDIPLQGDDSRLHTMNVKRGPDGKGLYAMKCKNCHQDTHVPGNNMPPGHFNWHLPPAKTKMVFEGKSPRQLATSFKDPKFTGFKSMDEFIKHVEEDTLVKNSFTYGTRPPLSHPDFVVKVKEWIAKGAAIPDK